MGDQSILSIHREVDLSTQYIFLSKIDRNSAAKIVSDVSLENS